MRPAFNLASFGISSVGDSLEYCNVLESGSRNDGRKVNLVIWSRRVFAEDYNHD